MKKLMIAAALAASVVGVASAVQAHRPWQGTTDCPSRDWVKCFWEEMDKNRGS